MSKHISKFFYILIFLLISPCYLYAEIKLIRDTQIEKFLYKISEPIFKAANLSGQVKLYIINDSNINAFVAGGKNIFLNTGTITSTNSPLGLIGIIAHETAHISAGHLARMSIEMKDINKQLALGYILGVATLLSGEAEAGQALILGSDHIGQRQFFSYSTKHEEAADEAALQYLDKANISSTGLLDFFEKINDIEKIYFDEINPYTRTHPLTTNRIKRIKTHSILSKYKDNSLSKNINNEYLLIKGKLIGFLEPPELVLKKYQTNDNMNKVARSIALHRLGNTAKAINILENITTKQQIYILELIGQFYYEIGNLTEALEIFTKIDRLLPNHSLIEIQLAAIIVNLNDPKLFTLAINKLNSALLKEKGNIYGWSLLANLYSKNNNISLKNLCLAEIALLKENYLQAIEYAKNAQKNASNNILVRASDIINYAQKRK
jgi:predicted Zn-dependent protease